MALLYLSNAYKLLTLVVHKKYFKEVDPSTATGRGYHLIGLETKKTNKKLSVKLKKN